MNLKKITTEAKNILIVEDTLDNHITREEQKEFEIIYDTEIKKILESGEPYLYNLLINLVEDAEEDDNYGLCEYSLQLKVLKLWLRKKRKKIKNKLAKKEESCNKENIKFISYTGKYPNLCRGTLTIEVNGKEYKITDCLMSGGKVAFSEKAGITIRKGQWRILNSTIPQELLPYTEEITDIVNKNIPQGCCGGCFDY